MTRNRNGEKYFCGILSTAAGITNMQSTELYKYCTNTVQILIFTFSLLSLSVPSDSPACITPSGKDVIMSIETSSIKQSCRIMSGLFLDNSCLHNNKAQNNEKPFILKYGEESRNVLEEHLWTSNHYCTQSTSKIKQCETRRMKLRNWTEPSRQCDLAPRRTNQQMVDGIHPAEVIIQSDDASEQKKERILLRSTRSISPRPSDGVWSRTEVSEVWDSGCQDVPAHICMSCTL